MIELLGIGLNYQYDIPRRCGEVIKADVRRIAYDSLYLYSKYLDPKYVNAEVKSDEDDEEITEERKLFPNYNT